MGKGVAKGKDLGQIDMRAIAPTLAKIMGAALPDAQAKAVIKKLRPMLRRKASGKVPTTPFNQPRL